MHKKTLFPMKLQFFAESPEGTATEAQGAEAPVQTVDDLIARVAELETSLTQKDAEILKWKNSNDKASSQAADFKRQLTARMSAQEQADQAKQEADEALKTELANLRNEVAVSKATKRYMALGMDEKFAEETAKFEIAGEMEKVSQNYQLHIESVKKAEYQKFLAERPEINAGHGDDDGADPAVAIAKALKPRKSGSNKDILSQYF